MVDFLYLEVFSVIDLVSLRCASFRRMDGQLNFLPSRKCSYYRLVNNASIARLRTARGRHEHARTQTGIIWQAGVSFYCLRKLRLTNADPDTENPRENRVARRSNVLLNERWRSTVTTVTVVTIDRQRPVGTANNSNILAATTTVMIDRQRPVGTATTRVATTTVTIVRQRPVGTATTRILTTSVVPATNGAETAKSNKSTA